MKKKFFTEKSAFWFLVCLFFGYAPIYPIIMLCLNSIETMADKIAVYGYVGFVVLLCPLGLLWKGGYVVFEDKYFIYRETLFAKKKIFQYSDIEKVYFEFARGGTRYASRDETVFIYFKKRKKWDVHIQIQYALVQQLVEKMPLRCQVKIEFYSLRIFSGKYRELLKDYLSDRQKEEIERLIAQKEAKRKKRTNQ